VDKLSYSLNWEKSKKMSKNLAPQLRDRIFDFGIFWIYEGGSAIPKSFDVGWKM